MTGLPDYLHVALRDAEKALRGDGPLEGDLANRMALEFLASAVKRYEETPAVPEQVWVVITPPEDPWAPDQLAGKVEVLDSPPAWGVDSAKGQQCYAVTVNGGAAGTRWWTSQQAVTPRDRERLIAALNTHADKLDRDRRSRRNAGDALRSKRMGLEAEAAQVRRLARRLEGTE